MALFSVALTAQQTAYEFTPLKAIDTISEAKYQQLLGSPDLKTNDFLVSKWTVNNRNQLALFQKVANKWVVFSLFEEQTHGNFKLTEDEQFLSYQSEFKSTTTQSIISHSHFCIVDLKNLRQVQLPQTQNIETWNPNDGLNAATGKPDRIRQSGCSSQFFFLAKGKLNVMRTGSKDFKSDEDCVATGSYEIRGNRWVKTK
ncbi:hypothetical protein [Flavobacterium sp.]|uniref:hypothetical protein n=1 Tax=Flavobacterium sp. TaxID=239 RepID=UPI0039E681E8